MIDLGRAFRAPFDDQGWVKKTLFGLLWGLLGVTSPALTGAQLDYIRGVSSGDERLPEWDDFGKKWVEGLLVWIAGFIYFLPVVVLMGFAVIPVIAAGDSDIASAVFGGTLCLTILIALVYGIAVSILFSAAMVHYALDGSFGAFFQFGEILAKVRGGSGYWTAWLYALIVSFAGSAVTSVLSATGIGYILFGAVTYLMMMISGHIFGQWARDAYSIAPSAAPAAPAYAPPAAPVAPVPPASPAPPYAPPAAESYAPQPVSPVPPAPAAPAAPVAPEAPPVPVVPAPPAAPVVPSEPEGQGVPGDLQVPPAPDASDTPAPVMPDEPQPPVMP